MLVHAQDQAVADSLKKLYKKENLSYVQTLELLKDIAENETDPPKKIAYSQELIVAAKKKDCTRYLFTGILQKGHGLRDKGDLSEALENYFEAASLGANKKNKVELGAATLSIADVYSYMGNHQRAMEYYHQAIEIFKKTSDSIKLASALFNTGDEFFNHNDLDSALVYFEQSGSIFKALAYEIGEAYNLGSMGLIYARLEKNEEAEENIGKAIQLLEKSGNYYPISEYLNGMADIYHEKGDNSTAKEFAYLSLELAQSYGYKDLISDANLKLSEIFESQGDINQSYSHYKTHIAYRDSVRNISSAQNMAGLRADFEVSQKQMEVDLLNEKQKNQNLAVISVSSASVLIGLLAFGLYRRNRFIKRTSQIIEKERDRSNNLLLNILPEQTAQELKDSGKVKAKRFESVTVLFADFRQFTQFAEKLKPEDLIQTIDFYFSGFDEIMEKHGVEKIKTIGDSYMAASGLPFPTEDHAGKVIKAALDMINFVEETRRMNRNNTHFQVRIGIHSGPVVAGVVGTKKFAYDIWGDTVNVAARMESSCEAGKINISESTCKLIQDNYTCNYRGEIEAKNKGMLKMYYIEERKETPQSLTG